MHIDNAGGKHDGFRDYGAIIDFGKKLLSALEQLSDLAVSNTHPIAICLRAQSGQQFCIADAGGESGLVMRDWNEGGAALAGIHHQNPSAIARQLNS